ncbi:MAG: pyridoxamine 5'-phosphate oxidase family protein [Pseudomonadales bacterium]|jgi:hypothetical protein
MGKIHQSLTPDLVEFIQRQHMFFVGSAPRADDGHVNVSPKGTDSFRVLDDRTVAYLDLTGSGVETIAHVKENARLVIMFCAFEGKPFILRLHGRAEVLEPGQASFAELARRFPDPAGRRAIIRLHVNRIADSCGWTVPLYEYRGVRDYYDNHAARLGPEGIRRAQIAGNATSIDGLTGLDVDALTARS